MSTDNDESSVPRRKLRFIPKGPSRRKREPTVPKSEREVADDEDDDGEAGRQAQALLRQFNENLRRRGPKGEKKSSVKVAFGPGADTSSTSIRTYGTPKDVNSGQSSSIALKGSDDEQGLSTLPSDVSMEDAIDAAPPQTVKKRYTECWDYEDSYHPTTLPLRKPNSGDPEVLNENEFGKDAEKEYDESPINAASELGLLDEKEKQKMFLVKLPTILPYTKRSATAKGKEKVGSSASVESIGAPKKEGCSLEELPGGYMGKMLVCKSGAIKLKLGNALYDVSPGSDCVFAQEVVLVDSALENCGVLGELRHRAVITPNVDSLLNVINLD